MKIIIQNTFSFLCLLVCLSVSANNIILPDVLNIERSGTSKQTEAVSVLNTDGLDYYLFSELPKSIENRDAIIIEYGRQLEEFAWEKQPEFVENVFEFIKTDSSGCELVLKLSDVNYISKFYEELETNKAIKLSKEAIYFELLHFNKSCVDTQFDQQVIKDFTSVEKLKPKQQVQKSPPVNVKKLPQVYGAIRDSSQIPTYSDALALVDLIDFDSHLTLFPLKECQTEQLFSLGHEAKIFCFVEDISNYGTYAQLDTNKIYEKHAPYMPTRAAMFFRKQGFSVIDNFNSAESKEVQASNEYYELSQKQNLPDLLDAPLVTSIKPSNCSIMALLFEAENGSPLWKGIEYKTIKIKRENGEIEEKKIHKNRVYLVSLAALEGCH